MQKSFEVEIWNENALRKFALKMKWSKYSKPRVEGSFYHCVNYFEFINGFFDKLSIMEFPWRLKLKVMVG